MDSEEETEERRKRSMSSDEQDEPMAKRLPFFVSQTSTCNKFRRVITLIKIYYFCAFFLRGMCYGDF